MNNYRITSADFVTPGESLEPDAVLSLEDLAFVKSQTGLGGFLQAQMAQRMAQEEQHENLITIIKEQKFDNGDIDKL